MLGVPETACQSGAPRAEAASSRKFVPVAGHERVTLFPARSMFNECGMCQRAIRVDVVPPAPVKPPPANNSVPVEANASVPPPHMPLPRADHWEPSHLAMALAFTPPILMKEPPAYKSAPFGTNDWTALAAPPMSSQLDPSHRAMLAACALPANLNPPPAYKYPR